MKYLFVIVLIIISVSSFAKKKKRIVNQPIHGNYELKKQLDNNNIVTVGYDKTLISIDTQTHKIKCYVGCNSISAIINIYKNKIIIEDIIKTEMACPDYIDGLEEQFLINLAKTNNYKMDKSLFLYHDATLLFVLKKKIE